MIEVIGFMIRVQAAWTINSYLYNLRRIPLIKKLFPEKLFRKGRLKDRLGILGQIIQFLFGFVTKALYYFVFFTFAMNTLYEKNPGLFGDYFFWLMIWISVFLGGIFNHPIKILATPIHYLMVEHFKLPSKAYFLARALKEYITYFIQHALILFVFNALYLHLEYMHVLTALIWVITLRLWMDVVMGFFFGRKKKEPAWWVYGLMTLFSFALAYGLIFLPSKIMMISSLESIFHPLTIFLSLLLGFFAVRRLKRLTIYGDLAKEESQAIDDFQEMKEDVKTAGVSLDEKDLRLETKSGTEKKRGYAYLHALFFQRHFKMFGKKIRKRVLIVGGVFLVAILAAYIFPNQMREIATNLLLRKGIWFYIVYLLSLKDEFSKVLFYNLDRWMLNYPFYRRSKDILECYQIRLRASFLYNVPVMGILMLGLMIFYGMLGIFSKILPILLLIFVLTLFFAAHYLTLYYMVQPYTEQMTVKNTWYSIVNGLVYMISWILFMQDHIPDILVYVLALIALVYTLISLVLVYRLAPKNFKLRV